MCLFYKEIETERLIIAQVPAAERLKNQIVKNDSRISNWED